MTLSILICVLALLSFVLIFAVYFMKNRLDALNEGCQVVLDDKNQLIKDLYDAIDAKDLTIETLKAEMTEKNSSISQAKDMIGQLSIAKNVKLEIMRRL